MLDEIEWWGRLLIFAAAGGVTWWAFLDCGWWQNTVLGWYNRVTEKAR